MGGTGAQGSKKSDLERLLAYDRWANARFLEVLTRLDRGRLEAPVESSFPSLLATFAHIVGAEWIWLRRFRGESPTAVPGWLAEPRLPELSARLAAIEDERDELLASLGDHDLEAPLAFRTMSGEPHRNRLLDLFHHVVNHSSYHRGQLTTLLRQVGAEPPATDYVLFQRDSP